jgi:hypothetical protein
MQKTTAKSKPAPVKSFTIADGEPRLSEIINVIVGDRFVVDMPKPDGRIIEPWLGTPHDLAEHEGTFDDGKKACLNSPRKDPASLGLNFR